MSEKIIKRLRSNQESVTKQMSALSSVADAVEKIADATKDDIDAMYEEIPDNEDVIDVIPDAIENGFDSAVVGGKAKADEIIATVALLKAQISDLTTISVQAGAGIDGLEQAWGLS